MGLLSRSVELENNI